MKIKKEGQIIELDPSKYYTMIIKEGSILADEVRKGHIEMAHGRIFFVGNLKEFRFVENSDRIVNVEVRKNGLDTN